MTVQPGHPARNTRSMCDAVQRARADGIELLVFAEMAIPGYLLGDAWERPAFLRECEACGEEIRAASTGIITVFGNVAMDWSRRNEDGRVRKYNALFVAENERFLGPEGAPYPFCIKTLMPNYRQFDDSRHFFDLRKLAFEERCDLTALLRPVQTSRVRLGCVLCEDAWDMDYGVSPLGLLAKDPAIQVFINASASPFTLNKNRKRNRVFQAHAARLKRPLLYCNHVGIQNNGKTVYTFDGASCIYDADGCCRHAAATFEECDLTADLPLDAGGAPSGQIPAPPPEDDAAAIWKALTYGTQRFMASCGLERIVVGASGGIDSAVAAALYAAILPPENLLLVNMPSRYNSATTRGLARTLADNLNCRYADIPIEDSVALTRRQVDGLVIDRQGKPDRTLALNELALENVQARDRSSRLLAAIASAFGGAFTCNANKSEMTVGYTTLYGDLGGWLAALGDLWKFQVYALARHINAQPGGPLIPEGSIEVVPSAELSAAQDVDAGAGDPLVYPYHDRLFASWIERWERASPEDILDWYSDGSLAEQLDYDGQIHDLFPDAAAFCADLERWWNCYQGIGVAKRIQAPPVLAVKRRAFGFDHREAQMPPHYTARYRELKAALLAHGAHRNQ